VALDIWVTAAAHAAFDEWENQTGDQDTCQGHLILASHTSKLNSVAVCEKNKRCRMEHALEQSGEPAPLTQMTLFSAANGYSGQQCY